MVMPSLKWQLQQHHYRTVWLPSGWVFATVERIFRWIHFSGGRGLAAEREGWSPRNDPQKGCYASLSHSRPQPNPGSATSNPMSNVWFVRPHSVFTSIPIIPSRMIFWDWIWSGFDLRGGISQQGHPVPVVLWALDDSGWISVIFAQTFCICEAQILCQRITLNCSFTRRRKRRP